MASLFRFELAFDGIPQNIGFLQGIDEIGLPIRTESLLLEGFESMPCPHIEESCEFWFTVAGLQRYAVCILEVMRTIFPLNWQLTIRECEQTRQKSLYIDEWQVAFAKHDMMANEANPAIVTGIEIEANGKCIIHKKEEEPMEKEELKLTQYEQQFADAILKAGEYVSEGNELEIHHEFSDEPAKSGWFAWEYDGCQAFPIRRENYAEVPLITDEFIETHNVRDVDVIERLGVYLS